MLTGAQLGQALASAMRLKGVTQQRVAQDFGVQQPSVSEWVRYGRIGKRHLTHLVAYFGDVVGPDHWGLTPEWGGGLAETPSAGLARLDQTKTVVHDRNALFQTIEGAYQNGGGWFDNDGIEMLTPQEVELIGIFRQLGTTARRVTMEVIRGMRDKEEQEAEALQQRLRSSQAASTPSQKTTDAASK